MEKWGGGERKNGKMEEWEGGNFVEFNIITK